MTHMCRTCPRHKTRNHSSYTPSSFYCKFLRRVSFGPYLPPRINEILVVRVESCCGKTIINDREIIVLQTSVPVTV